MTSSCGDKPSFEQLLAGAKIEVARGRGAVNCTYVLAAQGKAYPRTCARCGLGPCAFTDFFMEANPSPKVHPMSFDKQHVMGAAAEASEPALVLTDQAPPGLGGSRFDQAQGAWCCVCSHAPCDGLDCGVYLPGRAPRKPLPDRSALEHAATRAKAWATRRAKYGERGHCGSYAR